MGKRLQNRVAVVTGGGRGIGKGIAELLAAEGARVVVNDLGGAPDGTGASKAPAEEVAEGIKKRGGMAVANHDTVATWEGAERIIKSAVENFGTVDILVNSAGVLRDRMIFNMTEEEWDTVIKVHLYGQFYCIRHASPIMRQRRFGRIINMSSEAELGNMGQANYGAAKAGIVGLTRTVARDLGKYGVTCNAVHPRARTRLTESAELETALQKKAASGTAVPVDVKARLAVRREPEDIAPLVAYLSMQEASYINGYVFGASGGRVALFSIPGEWRTLWKPEPWTLDELATMIPTTLGMGLVNPAPSSQPQKEGEGKAG